MQITTFHLCLNILVFERICVLKFNFLVSKIISHMGENHWTVTLALIKFSEIENFNAKIFINIQISYRIKPLLKNSTKI